jgi:hypothetical protein
VFHDTGSALFGVAGLRVTDADSGPGGAVEIWAVTDCGGAATCPDCGTESSRVHGTAATHPKDVRRAYGFRNPENQRCRVRIACTEALIDDYPP